MKRPWARNRLPSMRSLFRSGRKAACSANVSGSTGKDPCLRCSIFRDMLEPGRRVGQGRGIQACGRRTRRHLLPPRRVYAEILRDGQHQVVAVTPFLKLAGKLEADYIRQEHIIGWPSMTASASMPPTPSRPHPGR